MKVQEEYKTFGKSRSVRLKDFDYSLPHAYLITILCKDRQKFLENKQIAESVIQELKNLNKQNKVKIFAYCLMPDHMHVIISPRNDLSVPKIIRDLKGNTTTVFHGLGFNGILWQKSYHDHILRKNENVNEAVKYVLNNPVRAGLVKDYEDYKFCGTMDGIEM